MSQSTTEFLERLHQYIQDEASAQYRTLERQWAHPLHERVAKGWAIEGLSIQDFKDNIIRLTCQTNNSRFRDRAASRKSTGCKCLAL
jgi:hypothetical protein